MWTLSCAMFGQKVAAFTEGYQQAQDTREWRVRAVWKEGYTLNFDRSSDYSDVSFEQIDGKIYVNLSRAKVSSPMHEFMHLVFAVMK